MCFPFLCTPCSVIHLCFQLSTAVTEGRLRQVRQIKFLRVDFLVKPGNGERKGNPSY